MLILKAYVNTRQIEEIHVQNVTVEEHEYDTYKIRKPVIEHPPIRHVRSDGWRVLAVKVLELIEGRRSSDE